MKTVFRTLRGLGRTSLAVLLTGIWSVAPASAQGTSPESAGGSAEAAPVQPPPDEAGPNQGRVSLGAGMDFGSGYFFRGIVQETDGFIGQPYLEGGLDLYEGDTGLTSASIAAGLWNSMHSGPTGLDGDNGDPKLWYEADFYTSLALGFDGGWETSLTYTAYMSPNASFGTVKELALGVAYEGLFVDPYVTLAFELDGQADGGANEGVYLELGGEVPLPLFEDSPVSLSVPLALGFSLSDYYEHPVTGDDSGFGFFDVGVIASVPLDFMPREYGSWELSGGVKFLRLGSALEAMYGDNFKTLAVAGVSISY